MKETSESGKKKRICAALLAHVDAGKTTLAEALLYRSGNIRKAGRVDHGDAFLDTYELERSRGITIFSKQAMLRLDDWEISLLDTPGHVDFSAEMERTLQVLDYAVLVISGADGVQGHTETLWRLLKRYQVPAFLFVNKMDQEGTDRQKLLAEMQKRLDGNCVDFSADLTNAEEKAVFLENVAMCEEKLLENYLENGKVEAGKIRSLIRKRQLFPCYFGSALKQEGIDSFLEGLSAYMEMPSYPEAFGAKIYKISRDEKGNRLTHLKLTGGTLRVKELIRYTGEKGGQAEEKVDQIRIYSGEKYETVQSAEAGEVCAVTGLSDTFPGQGIGAEKNSSLPILEPVLNYQILFPEDVDIHHALECMKELEEEEPLLHVVWNEKLQEIHAQLMGEIQTEILKNLIRERFDLSVEFGTGNIVYKETIRNVSEGVGHFEPLRHYAEVHLLLEPGETGSGLQFASTVSEDVLDRNWQRLILTHLAEKEHPGVLTGSAITDMKITLAAGKAHLKHTEGGDFRQACYRAVRQGLMKADSVLLEPYYAYRLEIPKEQTGRALSDIQRMSGTFDDPVTEGEMTVLTGMAPVFEMQNYQGEVSAYTRGRGHLSCVLKSYLPCHNAEEVLAQTRYDPERDTDNPADSVFCAHGAGYVVKWDQVEDYMHLESVLQKQEEKEADQVEAESIRRPKRSAPVTELSWEEEKELQRMIEAAYRPKERQRRFSYGKKKGSEPESVKRRGSSAKKADEKEYLLVDGYNIIFAWEELRELAEVNLDAARGKLQDLLSNYRGFVDCTLILVFDAYKLEGFEGEVQKYHNLYVIYTKEAETADQYIEKTAHEIGKKYKVTVATSDGTEQVIIRGAGCHLLSAKELKKEVERIDRLIREEHLQVQKKGGKNYLFDYLDEELAGEMEKARLGKETE